MAFCPECGKPVTAEASKCASCGYELAAKPAGAKAGAARFKGTMLMATSPMQKPAGSADKGPAAAAAPAAAPAPVKAQAKATMIGTGLGVGPVAPAANRPAQAPATSPIANAISEKVAAAAANVAPAVAPGVPSVTGAKPKATVLGAAAPPMAAAAAAHAAPAAAAPIAAAAAGTAAAAVQARAAEPVRPEKNMAFAQTQHQGAFAAAASAARAAEPLSLRTSPNISAAPEGFDPHAETDPPDAPPAGHASASGAAESDDPAPPPEAKYLPGDPMAPQPAAAQRAPMLRYDDSIPKISRKGGDEKRWVWIAAGVIVVACLGLVIVLASRMGH